MADPQQDPAVRRRRQSCVFCIFAPRNGLLLAGKHNPELLTEFVVLERRVAHRFRPDFSLAEVQRDLEAGVLRKRRG